MPTLEPALYRQLTLLQQSHSHLIKEYHYRFLRSRLLRYAAESTATFDETKALAIVNALRQIGTTRDIRVLTKVAGIGYKQSVRDVAKEIIQAIEQRQEEQKPRETLLRASENTGGQDELLRAANAQTDTHPETLLRVSKQEP